MDRAVDMDPDVDVEAEAGNIHVRIRVAGKKRRLEEARARTTGIDGVKNVETPLAQALSDGADGWS